MKKYEELSHDLLRIVVKHFRNGKKDDKEILYLLPYDKAKNETIYQRLINHLSNIKMEYYNYYRFYALESNDLLYNQQYIDKYNIFYDADSIISMVKQSTPLSKESMFDIYVDEMMRRNESRLIIDIETSPTINSIDSIHAINVRSGILEELDTGIFVNMLQDSNDYKIASLRNLFPNILQSNMHRYKTLLNNDAVSRMLRWYNTMGLNNVPYDSKAMANNILDEIIELRGLNESSDKQKRKELSKEIVDLLDSKINKSDWDHTRKDDRELERYIKLFDIYGDAIIYCMDALNRLYHEVARNEEPTVQGAKKFIEIILHTIMKANETKSGKIDPELKKLTKGDNFVDPEKDLYNNLCYLWAQNDVPEYPAEPEPPTLSME